MIQLESSYASELEGLYVAWKGDVVPNPAIVKLNRQLAQEIGIDVDRLDSDAGAVLLTGSHPPAGATPLAQAYAGHQFGHFARQLGDGRALLLGEVIDGQACRRDLHLKGSGPTPFARGGDGKAVIGPILREYLISEFMHAVGIPTTRSLAALTTGETIWRNSPQPGAVLARVAASHIRIGTFQYFSVRGDKEKVRRLADYAIRRHYPDLEGGEAPYLGLLRRVVAQQARLVSSWMGVGFVHGVMNTDNSTISGETIDYGPCAFMDSYDNDTVFSSIDHHGRYAYGNQPAIAQWNLARFAESILDLIDDEDPVHAAEIASYEVEDFSRLYAQNWIALMRAKIGLAQRLPEDRELALDLFAALARKNIDFTLLFCYLGHALRGDRNPVLGLFEDPADIEPWLSRWSTRQELEIGDMQDRAAALDRINPIYIPRNHKVEEALQAATTLDLGPFESLLQAVVDPYSERSDRQEYASPAPRDFGPYTTYCGT